MNKFAKVVNNLVAAITYVQITRDEFEQWLSSTKFGNKWKLKDNTHGVYVIAISDNVGVEISSSIGRDNTVLDVGHAAIQMRMVSLLTGHVLNKKAQGQSHFKRTEGWRNSLSRGLDNFVQAYLQSAAFYDAIAKIEDREKYKKEMMEKIEKINNWQTHHELHRLYIKLQNNGVLTNHEEMTIDNPEVVKEQPPQEPLKPIDENLLNKLRKLYVAAKTSGDVWLMNFTESVGKFYKSRGIITEKQMKVLDDKFKTYKIAREQYCREMRISRLNNSFPF